MHNKFLKSVLVSAGCLALISCGGGGSSGGDSGGGTGQSYNLGMAYSTVAVSSGSTVQIPVQVTNYSSTTMNGIQYSISGTTSQGNKAQIALSSVAASSECTTLAPGATCKFTQTATGSAGTVYSVNWNYQGSSSSTNANINVISPPANDGVGINAVNMYYPQAVVQNLNGTSSIVILAYMSDGVYQANGSKNFSKLTFVDASGNPLPTTVLSGSNTGSTNFTGGQSVTFLLTAPQGASSLNYKFQTVNLAGSVVQTSDLQTVNLISNTEPQGILSVSPSTVYLDENTTSQNFVYQNTGNASVTSLSITPSDPTKLTVVSNTCPASLKVGQSCSYSASLNLPAVKLTKGTTSIGATYSGSVSGANVTVNYKGQDARAGLEIKNITGNNPDVFSFTYLTAPDSAKIRITNTGEGIESNLQPSYPNGFTLEKTADADSCKLPLSSMSLQPSQSCELNMVYGTSTPTDGILTGNFSISYNYSSLNGQSATTNSSVPVSYQTVTPLASLSITPESYVFGSIHGNNKESEVKAFTITNVGINNATNLVTTLLAPFNKVSTTCGSNLAMGESCTMTVRFGPTAAVGNQSQLITVAYIAYQGQQPVTTSTTLSGTVLAPQSANPVPSQTGTAGFAGGNGTENNPLQIQEYTLGGNVTFAVTNSGPVAAESFFVSPSTGTNNWSIAPASTCPTTKSSSITLAPNASCNLVFDIKTNTGTGTQSLDLSNVTVNWADDANLSGTSAPLAGAATVYGNVYAKASVALQGSSTVKVVQGSGTKVYWSMQNGYNEPDHTVSFASTDNSITVAPTSCVVNSVNPQCGVTINAASSATAQLYPNAINVTVSGDATVSPTTVAVRVFEPNDFMIVGDNGTINNLSSDKTLTNVLYPKVTYWSTAFGNGVYVSVGDNGAIVTSTDGVNWVATNSGTTNGLNAVAFANGKFVAAGSNVILNSTDGKTWTIVKSNDTGLWIVTNIAYDSNNSSWVATGGTCNNSYPTSAQCLDSFSNSTGLYWNSSNGSTWNPASASGSGGVSGLAIIGGTSYAINNQYLVSSVDGGKTWAQGLTVSCRSSYGKNQYACGLANAGGSLIYSTTNPQVYKLSPEGSAWISLGYISLTWPQKLSCSGNNCVLSGNSYNGKNYAAFTVNDSSITATTGGIGTFALQNSSYVNGKFFMGGESGLILNSTNNGSSWNGNASPMYRKINGVAYNGAGVFIAVADGGYVLRSADAGVTWEQTSPTQANLYAVTYGAGQFVAVGNGVILTSSNGTSWTVASTAAYIFRGVSYTAANGFTVVGSSGALYSSPNGSTWTPAPSQYSNNQLFSTISNGSGKYVAVGASALFAGSDVDGLKNYSSDVSGKQMTNVVYGDDQFIAVGNMAGASYFYNSVNGSTWTPMFVTGLDGLVISSLTYGGGGFVAVGNGVIAYSGDALVWNPLTTNLIWNQSYNSAVGYKK
ncbi:MAG: hypothetical protein K2Y14_08060 [Burkholderiales bacterium]|nr:hypothetical protein [Burkholderiales bacterium]